MWQVVIELENSGLLHSSEKKGWFKLDGLLKSVRIIKFTATKKTQPDPPKGLITEIIAALILEACY